MQRAKRRTLRLTVAIVVTFVICWTPYAVTIMWDQLDRKSLATTLPLWLRDLFFIFAVTNSCVNPFVHSHQYFKTLILNIFMCSSGPRMRAENSTQTQLAIENRTELETHV